MVEYQAWCPTFFMRTAERHAHALLWHSSLGYEWFDVDAGTAARAVIAAITAAREEEQVWEVWMRYGKQRVMTRCPDNYWREVDLS